MDDLFAVFVTAVIAGLVGLFVGAAAISSSHTRDCKVLGMFRAVDVAYVCTVKPSP